MYGIIINYCSMANLNRIKVVLVEKGKTGKWLAEVHSKQVVQQQYTTGLDYLKQNSKEIAS